MNKRVLIFCFIIAAIIVALLFTNNQEYSVDVYDHDELGNELFYVEWMPQSIADQIDLDLQSLSVILTFCFPLILSLESTFFPKMRNHLWRTFFIIQAALLFWMTLAIWVMMVFKWFNEIHFFITYYLVLIYLSLGVLWNLLLGIPIVEINFIQKSFDVLSLKKKKSNV
jgi:hypothetical protein